MTPKPPRTLFICQNCGFQTGKWLGKCPECEAWNSLVEEVVSPEPPYRRTPDQVAVRSRPTPLISLSPSQEERRPCGCREFDRALGGGVVPGSVVLLGGDPGIGKSTLMLQVLDRLSGSGFIGLYVSGEESAGQLKLRADRLGITSARLLVATETCLENILKLLDSEKPHYLVLDSIQTLYAASLPAAPGSITQVRETAFQLVQLAKRSGIPIFLIGHVTKEGAIAGPKLLEHMVDTVLYFEGDRSHTYRLLRTVKNRFGPGQELGVFEMRQTGLAEVTNPSALFLSERSLEAPGSVVVASIEGSRPILVEVQALVTPSSLGMPRRQAAGVDAGRLSLLVAVLEKRVGLAFGNQDIFVNVAGGIRLTEPAVDLGIIAALTSSLWERPVAADTLIFGEVGLTGEVRTVAQTEVRLQEGAKLGFRRALLAKGQRNQLRSVKDLQILEISSVREALRRLFPPDR
ncbi:DNA repair protein RadA [Desulfobacca acetoxidans]|uniref:DNA repair protein RadA n=1 Tax=Desulfobacca acetoxidans (strain ATCC 700848 / DSM 11109 / ASRB2) TaxID=880072 RepID=F2NIZ7_DESAR|nr:DNA repair protein RadA [Desulfobacca acetoxidans]AEB10762.1 DNA repair protein RadA [Desulfobacca acetoxidans DSM 11109]